MKILIIDDQELVLLTLEKYLMDLGYSVRTADNMSEGIMMYDTYQPDLVITDIDMPVIPNSSFEIKCLDYIRKKSGLEIIKHIKIIKKETTPVMVLSGNEHAKIISKAFLLGANDYMVKPLRLVEIGARVEKLLGGCPSNNKKRHIEGFIQKSCVGVVIPCFYTSNYKPNEDFINFVNKNLNYHLCFVNYNHKDVTAKNLMQLKDNNEKRISVLNFDSEVSKSEAIRLGMLHLEQLHQFKFLGFMNGDFYVNMGNIEELVEVLSNAEYKNSIGAAPLSNTTPFSNFFKVGSITKQLNNFFGNNKKNSTFCIEVFDAEIVKDVFKDTFLSDRKFEEEIDTRIKNLWGAEESKGFVCKKALHQSIRKA